MQAHGMEAEEGFWRAVERGARGRGVRSAAVQWTVQSRLSRRSCSTATQQQAAFFRVTLTDS
jgi:hypothetical protein